MLLTKELSVKQKHVQAVIQKDPGGMNGGRSAPIRLGWSCQHGANLMGELFDVKGLLNKAVAAPLQNLRRLPIEAIAA